MAKRKIVALYPVPGSQVSTGPHTARTWNAGIYALDNQGDAWFTTDMGGEPLAWYDWVPLPELPD